MQIQQRRIGLAIAAVGIMALGACTDDPIDPDEHPEAGGVVILDSTGDVLAMSVGANVAFQDTLVLAEGEDRSVEVLFLDADEPENLDLAFHPHEDEGESLAVTIADEAVVEYHGHDDHGHFIAQAAGETEVVFELMHGGHADFRSGPLTIRVE